MVEAVLLIQVGILILCFGFGLIGKEEVNVKNALFAASIGSVVLTYTEYYPIWAYSIPVIILVALAFMGRESFGQ